MLTGASSFPVLDTSDSATPRGFYVIHWPIPRAESFSLEKPFQLDPEVFKMQRKRSQAGFFLLQPDPVQFSSICCPDSSLFLGNRRSQPAVDDTRKPRFAYPNPKKKQWLAETPLALAAAALVVVAVALVAVVVDVAEAVAVADTSAPDTPPPSPPSARTPRVSFRTSTMFRPHLPLAGLTSAATRPAIVLVATGSAPSASVTSQLPCRHLLFCNSANELVVGFGVAEILQVLTRLPQVLPVSDH